MAAHEAGHLEFGTFDLPMPVLEELAQTVAQRYAKPMLGSCRRLGELFGRYPQPGLIKDLWTVVEDARVEFLLRREYPGLARDLAAVAKDAAATRSFSHGVTVREMVVDQLLLLSIGESPAVVAPEPVRPEVERLWTLFQEIFSPTATAEAAVRLADRLYVEMDLLLARRAEMIEGDGESDEKGDALPAPRAAEDLSDTYRPMENWDYRGAMDPDLVRDRSESPQQSSSSGSQGDAESGGGLAGASGGGPSGAGTARSRQVSNEQLAPGRKQPSLVEEVLALEGERPSSDDKAQVGANAVRYREWDAAIQDYRLNWCHVIEREAAEGSSDFVEQTLADQRGVVGILRRYFEGLRPPGLRLVSGQADGEDLDMDAAVGLVADLAAGIEPSDRLYVRREKRERDVAVAFLVDLSGSTSRQIEGDGRRVIDVEKEGLVLLCEALAAIGDQYAIYGYSGRGRRDVDFAIIKDFEDAATARVRRRLGGLSPLQQNHDGAAIRHATTKLLRRSVKTRLLVLISDGRPLDDGYAEEYALEDTKMALREARMLGIEPFCITVDQEANDYLRRMYGDVRFLIIDRASALPERLPKVYQRLTA